VDNKLICALVESGCGFDSSDIRAVTDLSLSVRAHNTCVTAGCFPLLSLLISAHIYNREGEHSIVEHAWVLTEGGIAPNDVVAFMLLEPLFFVQGESTVVFGHVMLPHFFFGHVVEFMSISQNWIT